MKPRPAQVCAAAATALVVAAGIGPGTAPEPLAAPGSLAPAAVVAPLRPSPGTAALPPADSAEDRPDIVDAGATAPTRSCLAVVARRSGTATALRVFRGVEGGSEPLAGSVRTWSGTLLATAAVPPATQVGWQSAALAAPLAVRLADRLLLCVDTPVGHLAYDLAPSRTGVIGAADLLRVRTVEGPVGATAPRVRRDRYLAVGLPIGPARKAGPPPFAPMAPAPSRAVNVLAFGAKGDGRTDDTAAIQRALSSLRPGGTLVIPAGRTFPHTSVPPRLAAVTGRRVLAVTTPGVRITGGGTLLGTAPATATLLIRADRVQVDHLTFRTTGVTARGSRPDEDGIHVDHRRGVRLWDLVVEGAPAAGIFLAGAVGFDVRRVRITGSRADGLHMTGGSRDGTVADVTVTRSGDDGVAVVSYRGQPLTRRITVTRARVLDQRWGRGVSVVGGDAITFRDIEVDRSAGAGIYLASESEWRTQPVSRVVVDGAVVTNANIRHGRPSRPVHGAVLLYDSTRTRCHDIVLRRLAVAGPPTGAGRIVGVLGPFSRVTVREATLVGDERPVWTRDVRRGSLRIAATVWNGKDVPAVRGW